MAITLNKLAYFSHRHSERSEESSAMWQKKAGFFAQKKPSLRMTNLRMTEEELIP